MEFFKQLLFWKIDSFHDAMKIALKAQYVTLSLPAFEIRKDKTIAISQKKAVLELCIAILIAFLHLAYFACIPAVKRSLSAFQALFWLMIITTLGFSLTTAYEVKAKLNRMKSIFEKIKILEGIIKIDKKQMKDFKINLGIWNIALIITIIVNLIIAGHSNNDWTIKLFTVLSTLRVFVQPVVILSQFYIFAGLVQHYLEWVDMQLTEIKIRNETKSDCAPFTMFRTHFVHSEDCKMACKIERIRKIFGKIHDLKKEINDIYSLRIWTDIVNTVFLILFFVYMNLIILQRKDDSLRNEIAIGFRYFLFWITFLTMKLMQSISICGRVAERGNTVSVTVHQMFSRSYCESVRQELTSFSLELLHRDPYIKAYKFFNIDYPLIAGVVRGIIMQLIALMQIKIPEPEESDDLIKLMGSPSREDGPFPAAENSTFPRTNLMG